jgi:hypothetical protein
LNVNFPGQWLRRGGPIAWLPCSPDLTSLDFLFFGGGGSMWKTRCTANEWIRWLHSKHGSLQKLQMLQRTRYSASGKRRTIGGMYAELQMALIVKCSAPNNFPLVRKKTVSIDQ